MLVRDGSKEAIYPTSGQGHVTEWKDSHCHSCVVNSLYESRGIHEGVEAKVLIRVFIASAILFRKMW